jgi:hypothetical protein
MSADTIARLKISLDDAKPAVLRRVEVPFDIRLEAASDYPGGHGLEQQPSL